jgi:hypothetical protein
MSLVPSGRTQVFEIKITPAGSRIVEGYAAIPAHGLALHFMAVPVLPGKPRASTTAPVDGRIPLCGFRIVCNTPQKSNPPLAKTLASMNAEDPA